MAYVVEGTEDKKEKMLSIVVGFGSGLVGFFSKLAPEAVEHKLGCGFESGISLNQRGVLKISKILSLGAFCCL